MVARLATITALPLFPTEQTEQGMATRPTFQRPPRHPVEMPKAEIEIPAPPSAPNRPQVSALSVLLPGIFAVVALMATLAVAQTNGIAALLSFGFMGISSLTALLNYSSQKSAYRKALNEREAKYRAMLAARRQELTTLQVEQQQALEATDPAPEDCLGRVARRPEPDRRLWERSPQDEDFLRLRLGIGLQTSTVTVKLPKPVDPTGVDPLLAEAQKLAQEFAVVPQAPVCLPLAQATVAGLAGSREDVLNLVRAAVIQLATHHSPDEVKIVAIFPAHETNRWDWLRWLPHVWTDDRARRLLACEKDAAHALLNACFDLLNRRRTQSATAHDTTGGLSLPYYVFLFADARLTENEPLLPLLLTGDKTLGACAVFIADRVEGLPKACRAVVETVGSEGRLLQTAPAATQVVFRPDEVSPDLADRFARAMAPIRLQRASAVVDIPRTVSLFDLLGVATVEDLDLATRWQQSEPYRSLAVPIGRRAAGIPLTLDIHDGSQGPHGLVAGTTGSGKSELLQAFVASLAANFHPYQVAFVLVDYKGGGMANAFQGMPHMAGTITNLQGGLALRALTALKSELHRRETLLAQAGVTNIHEYQKRYRKGEVKEPLPHLVVIVDEFAELKTEMPDFMVELVRAARVGRSLGVHLILATQKPAGVVSEEIWANSSFRICLRVERPEDSQEVLKQPDAAGLSKDVPGRAYLQVGANPLVEFQAAWGGAPYVPNSNPSEDGQAIAEVALDGSRRFLRSAPRSQAAPATGTQLQALVAHLRDVAQRQQIKPLPGPWLPPLPEQIALDAVRPREGFDGRAWRPAGTWLEPVVGLLDDPAHQAQEPLRVPLGREGHLAVYGAPGTGKTIFLQTLALSLALTHSAQDVHLYLLDFGGRALSALSGLPHVGGVIAADEQERMTRLMRFLVRELENRKKLFARYGVTTLRAYRNTAGTPLPAIVILLDNYLGFNDVYRDTPVEEQLTQIAREGGNLGIHLVLTATSPSVVKTKISSNITAAVTLRLADKSEYSMAVGRTGGLEPAPIPGRGLVKGNPPLEFQTALPAAGDTEAERATALKRLMTQMAQAWTGPRAAPVPVLPDIVPLCDLLVPQTAWPAPPADGSLPAPLGLDVDDLEPFVLDLNEGPHFVIAGPPQSGKTTFLQSWLLALAEQYPPQRLHLYLADFGRGGLRALARLPHVRQYLRDDDQAGQALAEIAQTLAERRNLLEEARQAAGGVLDDERAWLAGHPAIVLAIDDFDAFQVGIQFGTKDRLDQLIRRERGMGFHVLLTGGVTDLNNNFEPWVKALKEAQTGFLLGSNDSGDLQLFNLRLPLGETGKSLPAGQGFFARRGRFRKVKVATCQSGSIPLLPWVGQIQQRSRVPEGGNS